MINRKLVLVGAVGVGKSSILSRFVSGTFNPAQESSTIATFRKKVLLVRNRSVMLNVTDCAGQEKFRNLSELQARQADVLLLVYDVSRSKTLEEIRYWAERQGAISVCSRLVLVGNKTDRQPREVQKEETEALAKEMNALSFECSALTGEGIEAIFQSVALKAVEEEEEGKGEKCPLISNGDAFGNTSKKGCCCAKGKHDADYL